MPNFVFPPRLYIKLLVFDCLSLIDNMAAQLKTRQIKCLSWNVRGLNDARKRRIVKRFIKNENPEIICLQETKLSNIDNSILKEIVGPKYQDYEVIDARGTAGGVLLTWQTNKFQKKR